jgi:hypothetical protein
MANILHAVEAVRETLHHECKDMSPKDYLAVLEELAADIDGNIDAVKDENPELVD